MSKADDDLIIKKKPTPTPEVPELKLPPLRVFEVVRLSEGTSPRWEAVTVYAHEMDFEGGIVFFREYRIKDGQGYATIPRTFKEWIDVKEVLKTDGQVH